MNRYRDEAIKTPRDGAGRPVHSVSSSLRLSVSARSGFTMTELLIVIGIIVVVLALAVPAFNAITGSKSEAAFLNQVSALIARARTEAIGGANDYSGLFFYRVRGSDEIHVTMVRSSTASVPAFEIGTATIPDVWLDLRTYQGALAESVRLPRGIGIEFIDDYLLAGASRVDDGYIGFNTKNSVPGAGPLAIEYGGVLLFNRSGQLQHLKVGLLARELISGTNFKFTEMGKLLYTVDDPATLVSPGDPRKNVVPTLAAQPNDWHWRSSLGFVFFNADTFRSQGFSDADAQFPATAYSAEQAEEEWLDQNAAATVVNR